MFLTATQIHDGRSWLPAGYAIETDENGKILSIADHIPPGAVQYDGVLCPGFINVHCHTELSHMKGVIPEHTGLIPFLQTVSLHRNDHTEEQKNIARHNALREMLDNGIVAVGDIANSPDALDIRSRDKMHFHTFVESIGFTPANAERAIQFAIGTLNAFEAQTAGKHILKQGITPHAPYSVSTELFKLIDKHNINGPIAIHNQESQAEDLFYHSKEGAVRDLLSALGINDGPFTPTGRSSITSYLQWMSLTKPYIFVHNTYTSAEDAQFVRDNVKNVFWCLCPNANLYIENRLPDIPMLIKNGGSICLGTDSLASNHQLSIAAEINAIKHAYTDVSWEQLLTWATRNGAKALQMDQAIGSFERGKTPGILLLNIKNEIQEVRRLF